MTQPLVGIQLSDRSLRGVDIEQTLDRLVADGGVNTVFLASQTFHGEEAMRAAAQELGGYSAEPHARYYAATKIAPPRRAADDADTFGDILTLSHQRGIKVFSWLSETPHPAVAGTVANWTGTLQVDIHGRLDAQPCFRNPDYVNWWLGIVEDQLKSYPIDGVHYGSERVGPLGNLLAGGLFGRSAVPSAPYCFCAHCQDQARIRGVDVERARVGFEALLELRRQSADRDPGGENPFVAVFRTLLRFPEVLAWEQLWADGYASLQQQIYGAVKVLGPTVPVGWHLSQEDSFSPLYRAENDLSEVTRYADYVKPTLHRDGAALELDTHTRQLGSTEWGGVSAATAEDFLADVLGLKGRAGPADSSTAFGADYIRQQTERAVKAVGGQTAVYPGLDPTDPTASVEAALAGGADGVILSEDYLLGDAAALAGAGAAVRGHS